MELERVTVASEVLLAVLWAFNAIVYGALTPGLLGDGNPLWVATGTFACFAVIGAVYNARRVVAHVE